MRDPEFDFVQGDFAYHVLRDLNGAKARLTPVAEKGHSRAQHVLGLIYEEEQAYRMAAKYFRLAAWQGRLPEAQYKLGYLYYYGQGVERDLEAAAKWLRLAAEGGDGNAQYSLGLMHLHGQGVAQDNAEAYVWLTLSLSAKGPKIDGVVQEVEEALSSLRSSMSPGELKKAETAARKLAKQIARRPKPVAYRPRKGRGERIYLGSQEVCGSAMEWQVEYSIQRIGDGWTLYLTGEEGGRDQEGPTDAAGLIEALEGRGIDIDQFIRELRQNGLNTLAQEVSNERE
jgi:Sel1 repeat